MTKVQKRDESGIRLQTWNKAAADVVPITPHDSVQTTIQMGIESIQRERNGYPPTYPNNEAGLCEFQERTEQYFHRVHDHNMELDPDERAMLVDIEGWAIYCGLSRMTLNTYEKRGGEWTRFILLVKDVIAACKKAAANDYKTPPVFTIFDLKVNHGYIEKSELKLTTEPATTEEQLQDAIDEIGLRWNEQTGEYEPAEGADYDT